MQKYMSLYDVGLAVLRGIAATLATTHPRRKGETKNQNAAFSSSRRVCLGCIERGH